MIITSETVIRVTPPIDAAAPTIAYDPGVTQGTSDEQEAKIQNPG